MIARLLFLSLGLLYHSVSVAGQIRIVCTAALTDAFFEFRKKQYIEALSILRSYGYNDIYIVEALKKKGPTFLNEYSSNVFYASVNNLMYKNNGVNEVATFFEALNHFKFDDDDIIVKFTGRHQLTSDYFLRFIESNPDYDAYVKINSDGNVFTLGCAMRCKYFKEMLGQLDFNTLGKYLRPIEYDFGDYIKAKKAQGNFKVCYIEKLYMKANIYGSSTAPGCPEEIIYY